MGRGGNWKGTCVFTTRRWLSSGLSNFEDDYPLHQTSHSSLLVIFCLTGDTFARQPISVQLIHQDG